MQKLQPKRKGRLYISKGKLFFAAVALFILGFVLVPLIETIDKNDISNVR